MPSSGMWAEIVPSGLNHTKDTGIDAAAVRTGAGSALAMGNADLKTTDM